MNAAQQIPIRIFDSSRDLLEESIGLLTSGKAKKMKHDELENLVKESGGKILRQLLQDHLRLRELEETREKSVTGKDGEKRTHVSKKSRKLVTEVGVVDVTRLSYGNRGIDGVRPLDAALGLPPEMFSLGVRKRVAKYAAKMSYDDVTETLADCGIHVPKRQVEELAQRASVDFDAFYAMKRQGELGALPPSPPEPNFLIGSTDAKGIRMRKEELSGRGKEGKAPKKKMAQVVAVYDILPFVRRAADVMLRLSDLPTELRPKRPRPENKLVWASVTKGEVAVIVKMFEEMASRDPNGTREMVILVDGNIGQLDTIKCCQKKFGTHAVVILDIFHVIEKLWKAASCFFPDVGTMRESWVQQRMLLVLEGGASRVAAGMRTSATKRKLSKKDRRDVDACARYLVNNKAYLKYDEYLAAGMPIGSGVVEGTCRNLINDRLDITGASWRLRGAEAVLRLRSLLRSKDFDEYWGFHVEQERIRVHGVEPESGPVLRLIEGGNSPSS